IRDNVCIPLVGSTAPTRATALVSEEVPAEILDGKILFNTAARHASRQDGVGLAVAVPPFNDAEAPQNLRVPGSVVSVSHDASSVACTSCHADFGGQDGRTWDFAQFGASLRNTMDLRGRAAFAPGTCSTPPYAACTFDAACGDGAVCRMREDLVPGHLPAGERDRYFNPMLTVHWNGDRDEVEDFEHTYRSLMGGGDCDGLEDAPTRCFGALVQRSPVTSSDPVDVHPDLGAPNRNLAGVLDPATNAGVRLSHLADFVYSLTELVENPNPDSEAAKRGRAIFNDPQTRCGECHDSRPVAGRQFFTDKRTRRRGENFNPALPPGVESNNPFIRHDVGTTNVFDETDPNAVATATGSFQNAAVPIPASRGVLDEYVTPVMNDVWNTRPYLHDGSAHFLLDVVRPCDSAADDCFQVGRGRNLDDRHGITSILTPRQLNDLTAFQRTLGLDTPVGGGERIVRAGSLALARARVVFGKRRATFRVKGIVGNAPGPIDPAAGVELTLATPAGEEMTIVSRRVTMRPRGRGFTGRSRESGLTVALALRRLPAGRYRFKARGAGAALAALDTGNRDLTVALEIGGVSYVKNRNLVGSRRLFRTARRRS
ncbi:MAG TPA: hypothetical protein VKA21_02150, partial [Candidatus Binatia bacterium]|nr:hypothetical protein [Candidatus Binatia bacterium]